MFWGLILKANKKYTQTLEKPFHLSHAALDHSSSDDDPVQVMYSHEDNSYLLCTLQKGKLMNCQLDLNFAEGDKLCFLTKGNGIVHLTGFLIPEEEDLDYDGLDSEEEEESETETADLREKLNKNKGNKEKNDKKKAVKVQPVEEDSDEDDDDSNDEELDLSALQNDDDDDEEEEDDEDDDEEEDEDDSDESEEEEEVAPPKKQKIDPQQAGNKKKDNKQQNGVANGQEKKKNKENQQQQQKQQKQQDGKAGQMQKLQGGLMIQDLKVGNGAEAKVGKRIQVYYEGRLKSNNQVFDATKSGAGFKMSLGKGEVIKGWDLGLVGMKVGGKRRLICPPQLAYGHKGNPPVIPANSTLVFDVELKNVL